MTEELKNTIAALVKKINESTTVDDALKYTQAAFNLACTAAALKAVEQYPDIYPVPATGTLQAPNNQAHLRERSVAK